MNSKIVYRLFLLLLISNNIFSQQRNNTYPNTKKVNQINIYFNDTLTDPYRWLEQQTSVETNNWIDQQNKYTRAYFDRISNRLSVKESIEKNTEIYFETPIRKGNYYFKVERKQEGKNVFIAYKKYLDMEYWNEINISEELHLKPEEYLNVKGSEISKDSKYLSYIFDKNGSDWGELKVLDLNKQKILNDHLFDIKFSKITWRGNGFYYTKYNRKLQDEAYKQLAIGALLYYHKLGTTQDMDSLIFKKIDTSPNTFETSISNDERYLIIEDHDPILNLFTYYYYDFENKNQFGLLPLLKKSENYFDFLGIDHEKLVFCTTYKHEKKVIAVDPINPLKWFEKVKSIEALNVIDAFYHKEKLYEICFLNQQEYLVAFDKDGYIISKVEIPFGNSIEFKGLDEETNQLLFSYSSYLHPPVYAAIDLTSFKIKLLERIIVNYKMDDFEVKKIMCKSDTAMIPMLLLYKKGIQLNNDNPTLMEFYGGYGVIYEPGYNASRISFIENGGLYVYSMIRGGGEKGLYWHKDAISVKRQHSINDVINCTKYLFQHHYTNSKKMAISGTSHGGFMAAITAMQQPNLFSAVIPRVGVYDMLRFEKFTIGSFHTDEYGSVKNANEYVQLRSISPLHQIKKGLKYPAMLFVTSEYDDRVPPLHSYKMVAQLQEFASTENPILLKVEKNTGHNGARNYKSYVDDETDFYSFIFDVFGINKIK